MLYSCTHKATVGIKGLIYTVTFLLIARTTASEMALTIIHSLTLMAKNSVKFLGNKITYLFDKRILKN